MKSQYIIILSVNLLMVFNFSNNKTMHKVFHGLYVDMQHSFAECSAQKLTPIINPFDSRINSRQLPLPADMRDNDNDFFPDEIQRYILNEPGVAITYNFNVGDRKVVLHFVEFTQQNTEFDAHAKRVCALMHLVSMHASRDTCSSLLNIYIYMTEFKKLFPTKKGEAIDSEHANTGMSYHCSSSNYVVVYRKEEWFKVLIHELFHALGISFIDSDMPKEVDQGMQNMLRNMYSISHPVRIYETYCEIWARILNVVFDCFVDEHANPVYGQPENNIYNTDLQVFMECVIDGLDANLQFAQQQCAKLLQYMDIPYDVLANPNKSNRAIVAEKYRESTNVFAYYILTCILLHSPNEFLGWCYRNNVSTYDKKGILQFRTIPSNFNGFMELLYHCKQQYPEFYFLQLNDRDILGSSMRMTPMLLQNHKI